MSESNNQPESDGMLQEPGHSSSESASASSPLESHASSAGGCCGGDGHPTHEQAATPQAEIAFVPVADTTGSPMASVAPTARFDAAQPVEAAPVAESTPCIAPMTSEVVSAAAPSPQTAAPVQAAAETAPAATAVIASAPPTLTQAAANDLAAALQSAQRARSRARSNSRGPRPSDLIEKKIVIRRDRWDALVQLTQTLRAERAVKAEPSEVAAIVLEAGLGAIVEESQRGAAASAKKRPQARARGKAHNVIPLPVRGQAKGKAKGKARAKAAPKPTRAAPAKPRTFAAAELSAIRSLVRGVRSDRAVQRTLALWLGAHAVKGSLAVPIEDLRALCKEFRVYDTANFAQNMKKDSAYFTEVRDRSGDRLGYSLTPAGVQATQSLLAAAK